MADSHHKIPNRYDEDNLAAAKRFYYTLFGVIELNQKLHAKGHCKLLAFMTQREYEKYCHYIDKILTE